MRRTPHRSHSHQQKTNTSPGLDAFFRGVVVRFHGPTGIFARTWSTGSIALWAALGLAAYMILYFL